MKTEDPCAPAGQVPIGAWFSAARAKRGSADAANKPPAVLRTDRRVTCPVRYRFIEVSLSESADDVSFHDTKSSAAATACTVDVRRWTGPARAALFPPAQR